MRSFSRNSSPVCKLHTLGNKLHFLMSTGTFFSTSSKLSASFLGDHSFSERYGDDKPEPDSGKPTVVVIGTGWGGARFVQDLDPKLCNIVVLSQRNHMIFTPLLPQTCSGTLEFRSICEPIQRIQPALSKRPNCFYRSMVFDVDLKEQVVNCVSVGVLGGANTTPTVKSFDVKYDKLILAHGARATTFNIPGVEENAFFLRELNDARGIRNRLAQNMMIAKLPTTELSEVKRLLHIVIVGGGPTGVEFATDLADFLHDDISRIDRSLLKHVNITIVEAMEVLGTFDIHLRKYGQGRLEKMGVQMKKAAVSQVTSEAVTLKDGEVIPTGLVVWSTGVGPSPLTRALDCDKTPQGRIAINSNLQLIKNCSAINNVYAIGDCAANIQKPLPTLAAVASRQGAYLAKKVNLLLANKEDTTGPFVYKSLGVMASLGSKAAMVELKRPKLDINGLRALFVWRSAYFTMLGSVRSRVYVLMNWIGSAIFGRDITYVTENTEMKLWMSVATEGALREQSQRKLLKDANKSGKEETKGGNDEKSK